ncbi:MAG: TonB-dependent receptor plug domain-containing protein, partial [candidate division Zixibacteria bacterium]|nr:TonB-dependent receptor plug domain-containing protein [candidate division Zixibacteria bacterium]
MQVNTRFIIPFTLTVLAWLPVHAEPPDSSRIPVPPDSVGTPIPGEDTLTAAQKALARFEQRYKDFQQEKEERPSVLSFYDSLVAYFTSVRQNTRERVDRSFYHDAGDYFRSEPSFFVLDHQVTPMRKTVQPFGLSGDRMNLIVNGIAYEPFEHIIEPDGLRDLNDLPTALDDEIYVLPGGAGLLFGGRHAVASLLTRPRRPQSFSPETAIIHDRGSFAYNYTRGRYSRVFEGGRTIDMSIGYRNALGLTNNRDDDSYNYYGDIYFPVKPDVAFAATGQLYDRGGSFAVRPEKSGRSVFRDKFDRNLTASLEFHNAAHTARSQFGYRHLRQGSNLSNFYRAWYNLTGHEAFLNREWIKGKTLLRMQAEGGFLRYNNGYDEHDRFSGQASLSLARVLAGLRYA